MKTMPGKVRPVRAPDLIEKKRRGEKIVMLTAYDATMSRLLERAGVDVLLVGDSVGMVVLGHETTIPVTLEDILHHTKAVCRGAKRPLIVADMPFMSFQVSTEEAVRNAGRLIQEGGAAAVKLEGGCAVLDVVRRLVEVGIPVMGHLGLTPQSVHRFGGFRPQAGSEPEAAQLLADARALEMAGAFGVVLESIPSEVAARVTAELRIPTIGIGAGPECDGQVLVSHDVFGLFDAFVPSFVRQYAKLGEQMVEAAQSYADDVRQGRFPGAEHAVTAPSSRDRHS